MPYLKLQFWAMSMFNLHTLSTRRRASVVLARSAVKEPLKRHILHLKAQQSMEYGPWVLVSLTESMYFCVSPRSIIVSGATVSSQSLLFNLRFSIFFRSDILVDHFNSLSYWVLDGAGMTDLPQSDISCEAQPPP